MRMCMTELLLIHMRLRVLITLLIISFPLAWDTQELKVLLFSVKQEGGTGSFLCHDNQTWALISPLAKHIIQRAITTITTAFWHLSLWGNMQFKSDCWKECLSVQASLCLDTNKWQACHSASYSHMPPIICSPALFPHWVLLSPPPSQTKHLTKVSLKCHVYVWGAIICLCVCPIRETAASWGQRSEERVIVSQHD